MKGGDGGGIAHHRRNFLNVLSCHGFKFICMGEKDFSALFKNRGVLGILHSLDKGVDFLGFDSL